MFIPPKFSSSKPCVRRGFRLRGNSLVLLFGFFLLGLFLHYKGRPEPVVAFWNDVRSLLGISRDRDSRRDNPYRTPEPNEDVATDERTRREPGGSDESVATDTDGNGERTPPAEQRTSTKLFDFEKQVDFLLPAGQTDAQLVRHEGYTLRYDEALKVPAWVAYPLLAYEITGDADRDNERFMPDPSVDGGTALSGDYTRSGYDRGHQAPAADFKFSQQMMRETFFMSNIAPQAPQFNRGIWKSLEDQVRSWAYRDGGLYVVTGPVLRSGLPTIGRTNEVAVPDYFFKVILYCHNPDIRVVGFLLKNEPSDEPLSSFVVPVDQIEQLTGLDFFPKIPDDLERRLESQTGREVVRKWFFK